VRTVRASVLRASAAALDALPGPVESLSLWTKDHRAALAATVLASATGP